MSPGAFGAGTRARRRIDAEVVPTTRCYPRTLREAFPIDDRPSAIGISGPVVIRTRTPGWLRLLRRVQQAILRSCR